MKSLPFIGDDKGIFSVSRNEIQFALNARKLFDCEYGLRFNENVVSSLNLFVGYFYHSEKVSLYDDAVLERFFSCLRGVEVTSLYAIPTGYPHSRENCKSMEVVDYQPPLIGKIESKFHEFSKIRGGQIGLYSGRHYLFSPCLSYSLLDVNGYYSLVMGPRDFLFDVLGETVEESWSKIWKEGMVHPLFTKKLREAASTYCLKGCA